MRNGGCVSYRDTLYTFGGWKREDTHIVRPVAILGPQACEQFCSRAPPRPVRRARRARIQAVSNGDQKAGYRDAQQGQLRPDGHGVPTPSHRLSAVSAVRRGNGFDSYHFGSELVGVLAFGNLTRDGDGCGRRQLRGGSHARGQRHQPGLGAPAARPTSKVGSLALPESRRRFKRKQNVSRRSDRCSGSTGCDEA